MDQLSKTISEGNAILDLEDQMKQLAAQMEEYKRLKNKSDNLVVTEDVGKKSSVVVAKEDDVANNNKSEGVKGVKKSKNNERSSGTEKNEEPSGDDDSVNDAKFEKSDDKQVQCDEKQNATSSSSGSSSSSSDNGNSSDSDDDIDIVESSNSRSRGKRRRGRRDNTIQKEDEDCDNAVATLEKSQENENKTEIVPKDKIGPTEPATKKTPKKDDKRRCIGRKALTDYTVGKTYSGTVKYIKPKLGAFIDIGSHSDVFVHISFISNEFVSSINDDILKVGDVIENVRVIEIDREKKRITGSLRSDDMAESEKERLESTRQFENNNNRGISKNKYSEKKGSGWSGDRNNSSSIKKEYIRFDADDTRAKATTESRVSKHDYVGTSEGQVQRYNAVISPAQSGEKSAADLKRERKLARRAERRAAKEATNQ